MALKGRYCKFHYFLEAYANRFLSKSWFFAALSTLGESRNLVLTTILSNKVDNPNRFDIFIVERIADANERTHQENRPC